VSSDTRRTFFKKTLVSLVAAGTVNRGLPRATTVEAGPVRSRFPKVPARVVVVRKKSTSPKLLTLDQDSLSSMLERAVAELTGLGSPQGWQLLFHATDQIGIKVNTLAGKGISTHPELAFTLADRISRLAAVKPGNIIVWDREDEELKRAGYPLRLSHSEVRCFGTDHANVGYEKELSMNGHVCGLLSTILTRHTNVTVNVPVLKDHNLSGLSGCLKNMYGAIHNPNKYHDNNCDPFVAQLNALPEISHKQGLIVVDALTVQFEGGPGYQAHYTVPANTIVVGLDPVAVDSVSLNIIDALRQKNNLPPLQESDHPPLHLATAAKAPYNLGTIDYNQIVKIEVEV